jgi:hypothetical protein
VGGARVLSTTLGHDVQEESEVKSRLAGHRAGKLGCMSEWIDFDLPRAGVPLEIQPLLNAVQGLLPSMAATEDSSGGLRRPLLVDALAPAVAAYNLRPPRGRTFAASEIDLVSRELRLAVSVQAGRARTNNGALMAVLAAAAMPDVDWMILVAPAKYKGSATAEPIRRELATLAASDGVTLSLGGVALLGF